MSAERIAQAVANLEAWLESVRVEGGYGGPVVHWWQNCLTYTGAGLDWRYEGIITGYLTLWRRTVRQQWLQKARRAGDDLLAGQLPGGNFRASSFEQNPYPRGTPHEAAADLGLLRLAQALRAAGDDGWRPYAAAAEQNLRCYYLEKLWDEDAQAFRDDPHTPSFVPNKACTLVEALFAWAHVTGDDEPITRYALPTLEAVLALQRPATGRLRGAIAQNALQGRVVEKYFPYYVARCAPALLLAYEHTGQERWLDAAVAALEFVARHAGGRHVGGRHVDERHVDERGLLPQVLYPAGANVYPQWIAPLGDVLRAAKLLAEAGHTVALPGMERALLRGQSPAGGVATARGFGAQVSQRPPDDGAPEFRDHVPVAGWCDKAFRYLCARLPAGTDLPPPQIEPASAPCCVRGRPAVWTETAGEMALRRGETALYRWSKGSPWAAAAAPEATWK